MGLSSAGLTGGGETTHFLVKYEDTLSNQTAIIQHAQALLTVIENEFKITTGWFNIPGEKFENDKRQAVNINLADTVNPDGSVSFPGANNGGYRSNINLDAQNSDSTANSDERLKNVFIAEWVEILMSLSNGKWNAADSSGEALSQYCCIVRFNTGHYAYYNSFVNDWLNSERSDWVNSTEPTDKNSISFGCGLAFLFYLSVQLGFTINQIIASGASNLRKVYENLTGDTDDPFPAFKQMLDIAFPKLPVKKILANDNDNPFSLTTNLTLSTRKFINSLTKSQNNFSVRFLINTYKMSSLRGTLNSKRRISLL